MRVLAIERLRFPKVRMAISIPLSPQMRGVAAMIVAALLLTLNDAISKYLTQTYSVGQVIALRQLCSLLVIFPYIHWVSGWGALRVSNRTGMAVRAACFIATTGFIVLSFSLLPLALVTAIAFSSPIFVVAFSQAFLGEKAGARGAGSRSWRASSAFSSLFAPAAPISSRS